MAGGLPPFFTGQAYNLGFSWEGRGYGEPTVLLLSGAGLVVAAVLRRSRRS